MISTQQQWLDQVGSVLETLNQGVIINDEARRVVFANSMFLEMIKMPAGELLGRSIVDFYPQEPSHAALSWHRQRASATSRMLGMFRGIFLRKPGFFAEMLFVFPARVCKELRQSVRKREKRRPQLIE